MNRIKNLVPTPLRRLIGHELRVLVSLVLWVARRRGGVRQETDRAFGHARDQAAIVFALTFVSAIEAYGLAVLLRDWPLAHRVLLVVDVYGVVLMLGIHAASVTRPHVLSPDALRVRKGAHLDLRIPLALISAVRAERSSRHEAAEGVLNIPVASTTSLTLELSEPVTAVGFLGKRREVTTVRMHADQPAELLAALKGRLGERPHAGAN